MYFDQDGGKVVLWTNDKNLSLKVRSTPMNLFCAHCGRTPDVG